MVVTIIGIVAAIAVPRISTTAGVASRNALDATLANVRKSIDVYYAEHGKFPGYNPTNGTPDGTHFVNQLLMYSDAGGRTNQTLSGAYQFGPYLRSPFPVNPTNKLRTVAVKATAAAPDPADGSVGWVAVLATGDFGISATDVELDKVGVVELVKKVEVRGK